MLFNFLAGECLEAAILKSLPSGQTTTCDETTDGGMDCTVSCPEGSNRIDISDDLVYTCSEKEFTNTLLGNLSDHYIPACSGRSAILNDAKL